MVSRRSASDCSASLGAGESGVSGCSTGGCTEGSSAGFFPPQAVRVSSSSALSSAQRIRFMGDVFLSGIQNFPPECEKPPELTVVPPEKLGPLSWSSDSVLMGVRTSVVWVKRSSRAVISAPLETV